MRELETALDRLRAYVQGKKLFEAGAKLLVACSGGADSVALLYLLARLRSLMQITLLAVHIDHGLRGADSEADAEYVKDLCQRLNIPVIVRKLKLEGSRDLENRARRKRLEIFDQLLRLYRFDFVVTAHHRNDQAETLLMNLFRGTGITGLAGIKPASGRILHPLLCFNKAELVGLLKAENLSWREDSSNADDRFRRNWIRNRLLPLLEEKVNPALTDKLAAQAEVFLEADQWLRQNSAKLLKKLTLEQDAQRIVLSLPGLAKLPRIQQYYVLRLALGAVCGSEHDFFRHSFDEVMRLAGSQGSKETRLASGATIRRQYDRLLLAAGEQKTEIPEPYIVDADRSRAVYGRLRFSFRTLKVLPQERLEDGYNVYLDAERICHPFTIRSRREGDRFIPLGMDRFRKLKEFFIDLKVPRAERDLVPLFDDGEKVFWVAGYRLDDRVRITESTTSILHISAEPVDEKPKRAASRIKAQGENNEPDESRYIGGIV
jgi:tRNA(Ile)-lysidine synthase